MKDRYHTLVRQQMRIVRDRHRLVESRLHSVGIGIHPSQHFALMHLSINGSITSQSKIAETLNVSPAGVARTIKSLEEGGYILRSDGVTDSRRNEITITEKGRCVVEESRKVFEEMDARIFAGLTPDELDIFGRLQQKMIDNIESMSNSPQSLPPEGKGDRVSGG